MLKLRIIHTSNTYLPKLDGVALVVKNVSERLVAKGHEVHVATNAFDMPATESINGVIVHRFDFENPIKARAIGEVRRYQELITSGKWDIVVAHAAACHTTNYLTEVLDLIKSKLVFVSHGLGSWNHPLMRRKYEQLGEALRKFDAIIELSRLLVEKDFYKRYSLKPPVIIPNGVDLAEFATPILGMRAKWRVGGRPWVINVSNHSGRPKGHTYLHQLARLLSNDGIVTTNIGNNHPAAKYLLGRLGLKGGCYYQCLIRTFFGSGLKLKTGASRAEICSALKEADIFVLTSNREAFPLVILEAMAAGLPWVAFDVGNLRELQGGIIVGSLDEMVETIRFLLAHPEESRVLGERGQRLVQEKYNWDDVADEYEGLYMSLVEN